MSPNRFLSSSVSPSNPIAQLCITCYLCAIHPYPVCPVGTIYCADIGPASSLTCIPIDQFCDGVVNCPNGLDESADFCGSKSTQCCAYPPVITLILSDCSLGEIQCPGDPTLTCVNNTFACNGVMDCPNGIDEAPVACGELRNSHMICIESRL